MRCAAIAAVPPILPYTPSDVRRSRVLPALRALCSTLTPRCVSTSSALHGLYASFVSVSMRKVTVAGTALGTGNRTDMLKAALASTLAPLFHACYGLDDVVCESNPSHG